MWLELHLKMIQQTNITCNNILHAYKKVQETEEYKS